MLFRFLHHKSFLVLNSFQLKLNALEQYETLRANVLVMPTEMQAGSQWRLGIDNYQGTAEGQGSHNQEKGEKLLFCSSLQKFRKSQKINGMLQDSFVILSWQLRS